MELILEQRHKESPFVPWSDSEGDRAAGSGTGFACVLELVSLQLGYAHQGVHWAGVTGVVGLSNASLLAIGAINETIGKLQKLLRVLGLCPLSLHLGSQRKLILGL